MSSSATGVLPPSGEQYEIAYAHHRVVVTEVGATLRMFSTRDRDVIDGFDITQQSVDGRGQVLAPWPNRLGDGRYEFEGTAARAALDEPERRNAIHGLVRWLPWRLVGRAQNVVTLATVLAPQPGYAWRVALTVEYRLGREGLSVMTEAQNLSGDPAPFGIGFHPYLKAGESGIATARLRIPGSRRLVSDDRGLPTGEVDVGGSEFDFREKRVIGSTRLDTGYTDLERDSDGFVRAELEDPVDGNAISVWGDRSFEYLMVYTADHVGDPSRSRRAVAIEPMTCPPDALRSGRSVIRIQPDASWRGRWGINTA